MKLKTPKLPNLSKLRNGDEPSPQPAVGSKSLLGRLSYRTRNLGLAAALAFLAFLLTLMYVRGYRSSVDAKSKLATVFVAARDIPAGTRGSTLVGNALSPREVPRRSIVPGAISSKRQIARLVAAGQIFAGEQITTRRFLPLAQQGLRGQLRGALRAISIAGSANQLLAGTLREGDRVDVVDSIKYGGGEVEKFATKVILRNILVLEASVPAEGGSKVSGGTGEHSAVLALTDNQAQKLFHAVAHNRWTLVLRPLGRASDSAETIVTGGSLLAGGAGR